MATDEDTDITEVPVDTLDNTLAGETPALIKIDVEGFETEVLNGAASILASPGLKAIIIELNGAGNRYGFDDKDIHRLLLNHGFKTMQYTPFARELKYAQLNTEHKTLYL